MPDFSEHIIWPEHSSLHACTLCACMQGPISQPNWVGSERSKYLWNWDNMPDLSGHKILPEHTNLCACTLYACMLGLIYQPNWCLHVQAHISAKLGRIRNIKVSMESGEHSGPVWAHNLTQASKLACMHAMCLRAQAHISAKLGRIRKIKVFMESGEHARHVWTHNMNKACKLVCMHTMC